MPGAKCFASPYFTLTAVLGGRFCYAHFVDGEAEAWRGLSNLPKVTQLIDGVHGSDPGQGAWTFKATWKTLAFPNEPWEAVERL